VAQRSVLVTGGLGGIGAAIVETFIADGDILFVFDCLDSQHATVKELEKKGGYYLHVDVTHVSSVQNGFTRMFEILQQKGIQGLDILINNAGITRDGLAIRMPEADWDTVLAVNLKGAFLCSSQALKKMMRQNKSYIINMASVVGLLGNSGQSNYAASKAGLIALTKSLAQEYAGRNILINAIAPGFIQTAMTDRLGPDIKKNILGRIGLKRFGTPYDVACLVKFLTSGNADYITGQVIIIDGGLF